MKPAAAPMGKRQRCERMREVQGRVLVGGNGVISASPPDVACRGSTSEPCGRTVPPD